MHREVVDADLRGGWNVNVWAAVALAWIVLSFPVAVAVSRLLKWLNERYPPADEDRPPDP